MDNIVSGLVYNCLATLKGRKGFDWWWDELDEELQEEIKQELFKELYQYLEVNLDSKL